MTPGRTALVTGANHGIGAATAVALARRGCAVLCTYLRVQDEVDPGTPQAYRDHRAGTADAVVAQIEQQAAARSRSRLTFPTRRLPQRCSKRLRSDSARSASWSTMRLAGWLTRSSRTRPTGSAGPCSR